MFELTPSVVVAPDRLRRFAEEVRRDLSGAPRQLQSTYLYDSLGSCLFEAICRLPWYQITRAEMALLDREADAIVEAVGGPLTIIELGCGSGAKLVRLAEALQRAERSARVHLIDISTEALALSERTLGARARLGRRAPRDLRDRAAPGGRRAARRRPAARPAPAGAHRPRARRRLRPRPLGSPRRLERGRVPLAGLVFDVEAGETIWTESSYKYVPK